MRLTRRWRVLWFGRIPGYQESYWVNEIIACITCAPDSTQSIFPAKDALTGRFADIIKVEVVSCVDM